jgi:glycosyltransferase involved in cell wall biosynthesis
MAKDADDYYRFSDDGYYPDLLLPVSDEISFHKGINVFWVEIKATENLVGSHRLNIKIHSENTTLAENSLNIEVIDCNLDFNYFIYTKSIDERDKFTIVMLYHTAELKGCKYGFEALELVKQKYPQLRVTLFGTLERPTDLPEWYEYYQRPDRETHNRIYNEAAIFLGTSSSEGWPLVMGEAMMCGAAVVCTDNKGYMEMAVHEENALVSPVRDAQGLADNIIRLIEDDELRCRIATNAMEHIKQFTWDGSYAKLLEVLGITR